MAIPYAFATLLTSDAYLQGALTLVAALKDVHPVPPTPPEVEFQTICLVTPETVDVSTIKLLRRAFDVVVGVELITQADDKNLRLLGRPDLNAVLTKLHVFRLTQYSKVIFLDADVLPIRPLSHLFTIPHEFSAVPDVGWPDIFNSGVLVLTPSEENFTELNTLLKSRGSWDGGDQGILNEWRGNNWNRLSFTYNTTPTAAYTYAPAYERYGSQISAIHFIGPNKPWKSINYRAPFISQQPHHGNASQAYDYDSLVDRWYAVYDKHYRSIPIKPPTEFEFGHYSSAWDTGAAEKEVHSQPTHSNVLGLEDLRRIAIEGIGATDLPSEHKSGEGEYKSLPLEGRFDLMHPPSPPPPPPPLPSSLPHSTPELHEYKQETHPTTSQNENTGSDSGNIHQYHSLPTPGPEEVPPSPHPQTIPLPSKTPSTDSFGSYQREEHHRYHEHHEEQHEHHEQPEHPEHHEHYSHPYQTYEEPPRPPSPPKMNWNPAIEPPPNDPPAPSVFPTDTYFTNVWDQTPSRLHDQPPHSNLQHGSSPPRDSTSFFHPPANPDIPRTLQEEGHYQNVIGSDNASHTFNPDPSKVKHVFPWEEKPRHMPARVFPAYDSPSPALFISPEPKPRSPPAVTASSQDTTPVPSPRQYGLPRSLAFANAWDVVPDIQRYASRFARPSPIPHMLAPAFDSREWHKLGGKNWDERTDASSRDGDDEDDFYDDDDDAPISRSVGGSDDGRPRSRSSSISASYIIKGKSKTYRVRGVQTVSPTMHSQGVQVNTESLKTPRSRDAAASQKSPISSRGGPGGRKEWNPFSSETAVPIISSPNATKSSVLPLEGASSIIETPPGPQSPREFAFPGSPEQPRPVSVAASFDSPSTPVLGRPGEKGRRLSNDNDSSAASPASSVGPISPPEGQPIALPASRKAARVFDPARGIELFKRGSEEVLARFLKMSSWDEATSPTQRNVSGV